MRAKIHDNGRQDRLLSLHVHNPLSISVNHIINVVWYVMFSNVLPLYVWTCVFADKRKKNVGKVDSSAEQNRYICYRPLDVLSFTAAITNFIAPRQESMAARCTT